MNKDISVWLIEDSEIYRKGLARAINTAEHMSCDRQFSKAEDALNELNKEQKPDVIFLDVGLPGMSGLEALEIIRESSPEIHVVILTVFDDSDKIFKAICLGARGYLLKTGPMNTVVEAVLQAADGGAPMTPDVASRVLTLFSDMAEDRTVKDENDYGLTAREKEVLELLADGLLSKEIADRLSVSAYTITNHLRNIYTKLHVSTNTGAVAKAIREGLI
ncbi:MAG: response regulator transcription factor [Lentisphaeraceae bacterium]|nr:response regulator transcription factor [Lentisphaeraceae bacterium]